MPGEVWPELKLSDVLAEPIRNGYSPPESQEWTGIQMLGLGCLSAYGFNPSQLKNAPESVSTMHPAILQDGDLLVSRANTRTLVGMAGIYRDVGTPCIYPDLMMRLRPSERYLVEFLEIVLRSPRTRRRLMAMAQGTSESMVKISGETLRQIPVPDVPVSEQQRIVEVLDSIDGQIEWILQEWKKQELVQQGALSDFLKPVDSDRQWLHGNFGDFVHLQRGFDITVAEQCPGEVPVVSSSGISSFHDVPKVEGPGVVTGRKGKLGGVYYLEGGYWPHDTSLWVTDFKGNDPYFVAIYMRAMRLERYDAATSVPTLNRNVVHKLPASFPDLVRQREIVASMRASAANLSALRDEVGKLHRLRHGLVDDLLSGRIAVPAVTARANDLRPAL